MVFRKSSRHALQLLTIERSECSLEARRFDDRAKPLDVAGNVIAFCLQLRRFGRVHSAADPHTVERDMEVQASALMLGETATGKHRGNVRFQGRLVFRKTRVSVDSVQ